MTLREEIKNIVSEYCSRTTDVNEFGLCEAICDEFSNTLTTLKEEVEGKKRNPENWQYNARLVERAQGYNEALDDCSSLITEHIKSRSI